MIKKMIVAFTLAEVLIVVGIIGIIAEVTIPDLIENTQNAEFQSKMKKEYSIFSQALMQITTDNGGIFTNALSAMSSSGGQSNDSMLWRDLLATKLIITKTCDYGVGSSLTYGGCFGSSYKYFANGSDPMTTGSWIDTSIRYSGVISDGTSYSFYNITNGNSCTGHINSVVNLCSSLTIDVNGVQPPNVFGKDMFCFLVSNNGQLTPVPAATYGGDDCGGGGGSGWGTYCAAKVIQGIKY